MESVDKASLEERLQEAERRAETSSMFKRQRDEARAQREKFSNELKEMRRGDLVFYSCDTIKNAVCVACGEGPTHCTGYPYSTSTMFSRLMVLWCDHCGMGWVPGLPFRLSDYYAREYARSNRGDRDIDPELYFSPENPMLERAKGAKYFRRAARQIALAKDYLDDIESMLDFGAGPGYALHLSGASVLHAVEEDENSFKYLSYLGASRESLGELGQELYDFVLCSHSLEHLTHTTLYSTLEKLFNSLKKSGVLLVGVPAAALSRYRMVYKHEPHTLFYSPESLKRVIERAGFEILFSETLGKVPSPLLEEPIYTPDIDDDLNFVNSSRGEVTIVARRFSSSACAPSASMEQI